MMPPEISVANSGMTTTGIRPRAQLGTLILAIHRATKPARIPPTRPPMKPAPVKHADRAGGEAGRDARPVGDPYAM